MTNSISYSVFNPFLGRKVQGRLEDWREGWTSEGKLIYDGLPIIRLFQKQSVNCTYIRPYYLLKKGIYVVDPETKKRIIEFINPILIWNGRKKIKGYSIEPVYNKPLVTHPWE